MYQCIPLCGGLSPLDSIILLPLSPMVSIGQRCLWHHCLCWKPALCEKRCNHWRQKMLFAGRPWGLPLLPKRSFCLFFLGVVLALDRLNKAQQFRRHQHLNILEHYQMHMFCDVSDLPNSSQLHNKLVCDRFNFWGHLLNCPMPGRPLQGDPPRFRLGICGTGGWSADAKRRRERRPGIAKHAPSCGEDLTCSRGSLENSAKSSKIQRFINVQQHFFRLYRETASCSMFCDVSWR